MKVFLGIDVGSVSTNLALMDEQNQVLNFEYLRTRGQPIKAVQEGLINMAPKLYDTAEVSGVGVTGSARSLVGVAVGADVVKNEITAHAVAANIGIKVAFEKALETEVIVPEHYHVMGAIGSAILARYTVEEKKDPSSFRGFALSELNYESSTFVCDGCPNICEVVNLSLDGDFLACWGGRCGKWEKIEAEPEPDRFIK